MARTIVVEFAGVPAAGKTTTARALKDSLRAAGFRVSLVREGAGELAPRHLRGRWQFNAWTLSNTLGRFIKQSLVSPQPHVVVFDRGLFDSLCWFRWLANRGSIGVAAYKAFEALLSHVPWYTGPDLLFVLAVEFETSVGRRQGREGFVVNRRTFAELKDAYARTLECAPSLWSSKRIRTISTDELDRETVVEYVEAEVLAALSEQQRSEALI